ncbi:sugar phosphate isomerase/epimerase [Kineococcus sp. NUM-3379]
MPAHPVPNPHPTPDAHPRLLASAATVSGPVELGVREWSLVGWPERCAAAEAAGVGGLGLWHADLEHQLGLRGAEEMRRIADDHGVHEVELEFLTDWFCEPGTPERAAADARRDLLLDAAAGLRPRHVKVGNLSGTACPPERLAEELAALCGRAAERSGTVVAYEVTVFDPVVRSPAAAVDLVRACGAAGAGVVLDTWHLARLGVPPAAVRALPPGCVAHVELADGAAAPQEAHPLLDTFLHRRMPGRGELDVRGYAEAALSLGYDGPWGVEVASEEVRAMPLAQVLRDVVGSAAAFLEDAPRGP